MKAKKLLRMFYAVCYHIDNFLYRHFGFVSNTRKELWKRQAVHIQYLLDCEHGHVEDNVL